MACLMPTLSGDASRIFLFLKAVRYGRHEESLPECFLTVKNRVCPTFYTRSGPGICGPFSINWAMSRERHLIA